LEIQKRELKKDIRSAKRNLCKIFIIRDNKKNVGFTDVYKINQKHKRCSLGYGIKEEFCGNGYATKATKLTLKKINSLGMHTVEATAHPKNIASQKVLEKNGFTKVGLMKDYYYSKGKYVDRILYWKVL